MAEKNREQEFKKIVLAYYRKNKRTFPWRQTTDPYKILVSEVMLQQTQTDRVVPKFNAFIKKFGTVEKLAKAPLGEVLKEWSGLGYNRRAKHLHAAAKMIVAEYSGKVPSTTDSLRTLPGVGPYIAGAVTAFAFNKPAVFIETNIRTAITHHFFPGERTVQDAEILPILETLQKGTEPREWYSALMDYGASLKRSGIKINNRNTAYTKQSAFEGSNRQIRGQILLLLTEKARTESALLKQVAAPRTRAKSEINKLLKEEMISKIGARIQLG